MKVDQPVKRRRGRPKGALNKKKRQKSSLPAKTTTTMVNKNAGSIVVCIDSNSSPEKSIVDVVSLSDTIATDVSDTSCTMRKKVSDTVSVKLKEARVVLENIFHSKLISPKQRTELLNRSVKIEPSTPLPVMKKKKQKRKKKVKPISNSSTTSDSSIIFLGNFRPVVTDSKFNPILTLEKIKVESPEKATDFTAYGNRRLSDKSCDGRTLDKKLSHTEKELETGFLIASTPSTDRLVSNHGSGSSELKESKYSKNKSTVRKRKRSETAGAGGSSLEESLKKGRSRVIKRSPKRRKRNSSAVVSKIEETINGRNSSNEGSKRIPKKNNPPKTPSKNVSDILQNEKSLPTSNIVINNQHIDNSCSFGINDLENGNYSNEPPILSQKNIRNSCDIRAQGDIRLNDSLPSAVCVGRTEVEPCRDDKLSQTPFVPSETEIGLDLDERHCCLESIAQAIDYDLAAGNRLSPLADIVNMAMPAELAAETCCLKKLMENGSITAEHPQNLQQEKEKSRNGSERGSGSHETSSNVSDSTATSSSNRKRKRPAIIKEDILPKDTILVSRNGNKKRVMSGSIEVSETLMRHQKNDQNNAEYIFVDQNVVNLPSSLEAWSKCSEINSLLQKNTVNEQAIEKHGCIIDDALNNNQEVNIANKNTSNVEKQEERVTLYSSPCVCESPDYDEEYDALHGLLKSFAENDPNSITEVSGGPELDNNHPNSITEVQGCPEFDNHHSKSITEVGDCSEIDNNVTNLITEDDENLESGAEDREVDEAMASFEATVKSSRLKNIKEKMNDYQVVSLTVDNVDKFDCAASGSATATRSSTRSMATESSQDWQSEDITDLNVSPVQVRRRRWNPSEGIKSSPAPRRQIRLNRGNWSTESKEKTEVSSVTNDSSAQPKNCLVTSKNARQLSTKNDDKIESPQRTFDTPITNNNFRKPNSPDRYVQTRDHDVQKVVLGFGEGSLYDVRESKSETDRHSDESSGSSSSSSSSDSSSSSSSSSSDSESSDDEVAIEKVAEKLPEKNSEVAAGRDNGNSSQSIPKSITSNDPRNVPTQAERLENTGPSIHSIKSRGIQITKEDKAQLLLEEVKDNEKAAGSLINGDFDRDKKDEEQDDCISLFAESIRCDSPPLKEPPRRRLSPLYKQMKSSNIDSFANANKRQCEVDIAAYAEQVNDDNHDKKQQQNKNDKKIANEDRPNRNSIPPMDPRNEYQNRLPAQAENKPDLRSTLNIGRVLDPKSFFFGHCWAWLKFGSCNQSACRFSHVLKPQLQHINHYETNVIEGIVGYAIGNRYCFFLGIVHSQVTVAMSAEQIILFYQHLYINHLLSDMILASTTEALIRRGMSLNEIVTSLDKIIISNDESTPLGIIRAVLPRIKGSGIIWETLRNVILKISPQVFIVEELIEECINQKKNKEHLYDVYENLIKALPIDVLPNIRDDLLMRFHDYLKKSVPSNASDVDIAEPLNGETICSIASPDPPEPPVDNTLHEQLPQVRKSNTASESTSRRSHTGSQTSAYSMALIDNLPPSSSVYRNVLWKFHWDLQGVQEGLKHRDYVHVISILKQNTHHPNRLPHMKGFYNILCNEIRSSKQHLAEIVRLTVQSGASNDLRQFVFDLGIHVLTKLADIGAWVLAHELLKTFQVYGTYNSCAYTLLAVEIYIANYRPLKALELLKRSQLVFTNTKVWNQMRCPDDEPLRVTVMELLLSSLCDGHAQHALALFEFILSDQCNNFKPINVSRYVDKIARALLMEKHTGPIIDFGRIVIQAHLSPNQSTFRALINSIFHNDRFLAKQLHRYATWLGAYNTAKISRTTYMVINNDWTEEEMFLMFSALIKDLSTNIGHAIGRLGSRQLSVFLILETIPKEKNLFLDVSNEPMTNKAIRKRKAIVRSVLEHFDPKIKLIQKFQGRLCKVQSTSLVNYLKAGHFEH